jgi:hypothetical protein
MYQIQDEWNLTWRMALDCYARRCCMLHALTHTETQARMYLFVSFVLFAIAFVTYDIVTGVHYVVGME